MSTGLTSPLLIIGVTGKTISIKLRIDQGSLILQIAALIFKG